MNLGTKGVSLKFGLVVLALGIVAYTIMQKRGRN